MFDCEHLFISNYLDFLANVLFGITTQTRVVYSVHVLNYVRDIVIIIKL